MAELLIGAVLVVLLARVLAGDTVELDDLLGIPELAALVALAALIGAIAVVAQRSPDGGGAHYPALGMMGIAAAGTLLVLFPERMPDTTRGGTPMTALWSIFGWLLIALAYAVVYLA